MKKAVVVLAVALATSFIHAQDYNKFVFGLGSGVTKIRDITPIKPINADLFARVSFNTLFGVKVLANHTVINDDFRTGTHDRYNYWSGSVFGVANVGRLMRFEEFTDHYTILAGIGGNYMYSDGNVNNHLLHRYSNFHLTGFIENEFEVSKRFFIGAGLNVVTGVNSRPWENNKGTGTTSIINGNISLKFVLGPKRRHADFYVAEKKEPVSKIDTLFLQPQIIEVAKKVDVEPTDQIEYVYFDHDSFEINRNFPSIEKAANWATSVVITAYCSKTGTPEYNIELARNRAEATAQKLRSIGFTGTIETKAMGIDHSRDNANDFARRVIIEFKK